MHPHIEVISQAITAVWLSAAGVMSAAVIAVIPDEIQITVLENPDIILDSGKMRLICVIGAIGGGTLSALIFTPPKSTGRMFAIKAGTSSLSGILFTPWLVHLLGWHPNVDLLLGFSASIAIVAVGVIRIITPAMEKYAASRIIPGSDRETAKKTDDEVK